MNSPMFSIIVVSLNAGEKLLKTVASIREQLFEDYEIVVKDGGSKDGSIEELKKEMLRMDSRMKNRIRLYEEKDSSIYNAMNQAVKHARGAYLYFLNCGDYLYNERVLEDVAAGIKKCEKSSRIFYGDIYDALRGNVVASNPKINGFACYRCVPCHQACFYDSRLFSRRGYEPKYKVRADYEHFLYSFYKEKAKPLYLPVVIASYEGGGFSETEENRIRSAEEHKEITSLYMSLAARISYRTALMLTLAPLRTKMAESRKLSGIYNKFKNMIYGKK